jgi:hypothetical protein
LLATPRGFEPLISTVTGWHVRPLHHGADHPLTRPPARLTIPRETVSSQQAAQDRMAFRWPLLMRVYLCQICLSRNGARFGARFSFSIGGERDNGPRSQEMLQAVRHSDSLVGAQGRHHVHDAAMSVSEPVRPAWERSSRRTVRGYEIELGALASI